MITGFKLDAARRGTTEPSPVQLPPLPIKSTFHLVALLSVLPCLGIIATAQAADPPPAVVSAATSESAEQKAALTILDRLFARIDALAAKIDEEYYRNIVRRNIGDLKARREDLRRKFDSTVFQDLKFDATIEHHRIFRWLAEPELKPLPAGAAAEMPTK